ncbi:N-methylhydantoinase B (EC [Olavius algarvensis Delta 1 endosymbiont]|nr:N-methylhydantoinase B (EC [Olavius algarvensis Delta 1 endosymbiont]
MQLLPQTVEIIKNRLLNIVDEMELVTMRSAYSILWQEAGDLSNALMSEDFAIVAQAKRSIPFHLGTMGPPVIEAIKVIGGPAHLEPGDILIQNDPYLANNHLNDLVLAQPVFSEGRILAYSCVKGHLPDIGGGVFSSCDFSATEIIEEGLRIPPTKIYKAGRRNDDLINIIKANIRSPEEMIGNLEAGIAGVMRGEKRFQELLQKYDPPTVRACISRILDNSEKMMRSKIKQLPDGIYEAEDYVDSVPTGNRRPKPLKIKCSIKIEGSRIFADFTGTAPQVKAGINCTAAVAATGVNNAVKIMLDPGEPGNDGTYRPIQVNVPRGTLINPDFPGPVSAYMDTGTRCFEVVCRALAQASPNNLIAAGDGSSNGLYYQGFDGDRKFINLEFHGGGSGAYLGADGFNGIRNGLGNTGNQRIERVESELPVQFEAYEIVPDTGGPGEYRGGCSTRRVYRFITPTDIIVVGGRTQTAPYGLCGGKPGAKARHMFIDDQNKETLLVSKNSPVGLKADTRVAYIPAGGGGIGNPLNRDPDRVLEDVKDGCVSLGAAKCEYGVIISRTETGGYLIDHAATHIYRQAGKGYLEDCKKIL